MRFGLEAALSTHEAAGSEMQLLTEPIQRRSLNTATTAIGQKKENSPKESNQVLDRCHRAGDPCAFVVGQTTPVNG